MFVFTIKIFFLSQNSSSSVLLNYFSFPAGPRPDQTCPAANGVEEGGLDSLADLVLDLASVIVERSGLLPALLPGPAPGHLAAIPGPVQVACPGLMSSILSSDMASILNSDWCRRRPTRPCW